MPVTRVDARNTKADILDAYESLFKEHRTLQTEVNALRKRLPAVEQPASGPAVQASEGPPTVESIVEDLAGSRSAIGGVLSVLSASLVGEATRLEEVRRGCDDERRMLVDLYGIDPQDDTLDGLIARYNELSGSEAAEIELNRNEFEREMADLELVWKREQQERAAAIKERDTAAKKARQREAAEYEYQLSTARGHDAEAHERDKKRSEQELASLRLGVERDWARREEGIAADEQHLRELKARAEGFAKELEQALKKATEEGARQASMEAKARADLAAKEAAGRRQAFAQQVAALQRRIEAQGIEIEGLRAQLAATVVQGQELAMKAMEGASSAGTFQAIREIALEQAKTQQKLK